MEIAGEKWYKYIKEQALKIDVKFVNLKLYDVKRGLQEMKKVFITKIPDKAGAFLKAGRIISKYNGNIERVNYNKTIDIHTLFIEVSAGEDEMRHITGELSDLGYLEDCMKKKRVHHDELEIERCTRNGAANTGTAQKGRCKHNIYELHAATAQGYQDFKMGIMFEDPRAVKTMPR